MSLNSNWNDLLPRFISAILMSTIGFLAIWLGGVFLDLILIFVVSVMHWELGSMLNPMSKQAKWFSAFFSGLALYWILGIENSVVWIIILILGAALQTSFFFAQKKKVLWLHLQFCFVATFYMVFA